MITHPHKLYFVLTLNGDAHDWKKFKTIEYPDGNWQIIIKRDIFDSLVGHKYNTLKEYKCDLIIVNGLTSNSRRFSYLGLDTKNNIDHWYSVETKVGGVSNKRIDLFIELN